MKSNTAVNNSVLYANLSSGLISTIEISDLEREQYLGGKGLALKLIFDNLIKGVDPLSPDNILVMMTGPTCGTASPCGGRFVVVGKSPLTGIFASSFAGGHFGLSLKKAGYDGIMVSGKADHPVYIKIENNGVSICDATEYWGMDTYDFQEARKKDGDWVVIGPAGENLVKFANIASGHRLAGRCGLGSVMGSKMLKGIVAKGDKKFSPADPEKFKKALKIAQKKVKAHENTGKALTELGTPQNVRIFGTTSIMPVKNFSKPNFDRFEQVSGETIRDEHKTKNHGCTGCFIKCGRYGKYDNKEKISPEYETIAMMGPNLEISDINKIAGWNETLNRLGLDSISTGSVIGFSMELSEKGMLKSSLSFGDGSNIDDILHDIAHRKGLGNDLAEGVRHMSDKYGGKEFANHVKGLEMAAYDPRGCTGQGLGYATANCGATHLSGSTHAVEAGSYLHPHGTRGKAHFVKFMQDSFDAINSAIFCIQTAYPFLEENPAYKYTPDLILKFFMRNFPLLAVATTDLSDYCGLLSGIFGFPISRGKFYQVGERIFNLERVLNNREGISKKDDTLPENMLKLSTEKGWGKIKLNKMLNKYYRLRGWDRNGRPKPGLLKKLSIQVGDGKP